MAHTLSSLLWWVILLELEANSLCEAITFEDAGATNSPSSVEQKSWKTLAVCSSSAFILSFIANLGLIVNLCGRRKIQKRSESQYRLIIRRLSTHSAVAPSLRNGTSDGLQAVEANPQQRETRFCANTRPFGESGDGQDGRTSEASPRTAPPEARRYQLMQAVPAPENNYQSLTQQRETRFCANTRPFGESGDGQDGRTSEASPRTAQPEARRYQLMQAVPAPENNYQSLTQQRETRFCANTRPFGESGDGQDGRTSEASPPTAPAEARRYQLMQAVPAPENNYQSLTIEAATAKTCGNKANSPGEQLKSRSNANTYPFPGSPVAQAPGYESVLRNEVSRNTYQSLVPNRSDRGDRRSIGSRRQAQRQGVYENATEVKSPDCQPLGVHKPSFK